MHSRTTSIPSFVSKSNCQIQQGKVAELGEPSELLDNEDGLFSFLVDSTGKESGTSLRRMASQSSIA